MEPCTAHRLSAEPVVFGFVILYFNFIHTLHVDIEIFVN